MYHTVLELFVYLLPILKTEGASGSTFYPLHLETLSKY